MNIRSLLPVMALLLGACGASVQRVVEVDREVWQAAQVPAPGGAGAVGPLPGRDGVALEGSISTSSVTRAWARRDEGAAGHIVLPLSARGRVGWGATDNLELGFTMAWAPALAGQPQAEDLSVDALSTIGLLRGGGQIRGLIPAGRVGVGLMGEVEVAVLPAARSTRTARTDTSYGTDQDDDLVEGQSESSLEVDRYQRALPYPYIRVGTYLQVPRETPVQVSVGLLLQNHPVIDGFVHDTWSCVYTELDEDDGCEGPPEPPSHTTTVLPTTFAALSVPVGPLRLNGQVWAHLGGDPLVRQATPFGGEIGLQLPIGGNAGQRHKRARDPEAIGRR